LYAQQFRIWIDFNHDGLFDASESIWNTTTSTFSPTIATGTATIPNTAYNGITRMRVASKYSSVIDPGASCTFDGFGEYEDYNVSITGGTTAPPVVISYTWSPATFLSSTTGTPVTASNMTATTTYTVTASAGGCSATGNVTVTVAPGVPVNLSVSGEVNSTVCYNASNTITVGGLATPFSVVSPGGNVTFIAGHNILFEPGTQVQSGAYMHGYISTTYCTPPAAPVTITGTENETGPEVPQGNLSLANFTLYPNPTSGNFTLVQKGEKTYGNIKVEVYSMKGEKVLTEKMIGEQKHEFRFSEIPVGLYFVKIVADDYVETVKLIKTR
jgi:hypothetical protein